MKTTCPECGDIQTLTQICSICGRRPDQIKRYVLVLTEPQASHLFDWLDAGLAQDEFTDDENTACAEQMREQLSTFILIDSWKRSPDRASFEHWNEKIADLMNHGLNDKEIAGQFHAHEALAFIEAYCRVFRLGPPIFVPTDDESVPVKCSGV